MKVAIIGSGPSAAQAALHFFDLGADVRVFAAHPWLTRYQAFHAANGYDDNGLATQLLSELSNISIKFHQVTVNRIHKARLTKDQSLPGGRSRLSDMFRVVVSENPKGGVLKQVDENPEVFQKLGDDVLRSLHEPVETFYDVDLVIACFDELFTQPGLTISGAPALNENRAAAEITGLDQLWFDKVKEGILLIVGGDDEVLSFASKRTENILHIPIEGENSHSSLWREVCDMSNRQWNEDKETYQKKLHEWRGLEDYMRVKIPAPSEPRARVQVLSDAGVVAVDRLIDREGVFVTLDFGEEHEISTKAFTHILNARTPKWKTDVFTGLAFEKGYPELVVNPSEPGFYALGIGDPTIWSPKASKQELEEVEEDVMKWFKPAGDV